MARNCENLILSQTKQLPNAWAQLIANPRMWAKTKQKNKNLKHSARNFGWSGFPASLFSTIPDVIPPTDINLRLK